MMTAQQIYDLVKEKLLAQGCPSVNGEGDCVYRGPNGHRCAAGWLIKDEHYLKSLEGWDARRWNIADALIRSGVPEQFLSLVQDLQEIHDGLESEGWPTAFAALALSHGLTP